MYLKVYLVVLSTCVLCLIILVHFQFLADDSQGDIESAPLLNFTYENYYHLPQQGEKHIGFNDSWPDNSSGFYPSSSLSSSSIIGFKKMGDDRKNSSHSEKSDKSSTQSDASSSNYHDHFDIVQLNKHLNLCIRKEDNEVDFDEYIFVFQQLYKFFLMLGTVFGFVGSDVKSKLEILQGYRTGDNKIHYETVEKMIAFEKTSDYINTNKESSGSRTLLRLHRALNFVSKFLGKVDTIKDTDGTSHVCKEAYSETLSKFHPWLIQKGAILAMYALPTKKDLISRVCDGRIENSEVRRLLHQVIDSTQRVFDQCETAYRENDLLDLP